MKLSSLILQRSLEAMDKKKNCIYSIKLTQHQAQKLKEYCLARLWDTYEVAYADFAFKGNGINIVHYNSGKTVVQGKKTEEFVTFVLEPEITLEFNFGQNDDPDPLWFEEHAGLDESGKGDLFGPLVTACVIARTDGIKALLAKGIKDSKKIHSENVILDLDAKINSQKGVTCKKMTLSMKKYNELYTSFGSNINRLLAWMHSRSLLDALQIQPVGRGLLDQFSKAPLVQRYLGHMDDFRLDMETKAERDPVVAAASIVARAEYVRQMRELSKLAGEKLQKGAGAKTIEQAKILVKKFGDERLGEFAKLHFGTAYIARGLVPPGDEFIT
ncbi:MAG: ribonuclease HIII [Puniceicoccales bacterium]|jgi:ribonuclease HIII|nr:ribonuclease HIII [Puniceicoccales bacterium]